jgi:hypothetical protein
VTPTVVEVKHPGLKIAGFAGLGAGAVAIGVGAVFGASAASLAKKVDSATGMWSNALHQDELDGKAANTNMIICYGVGGALVVSGAVLLFMGRTTTETVSHASLTPVVGPRYAGLVLDFHL